MIRPGPRRHHDDPVRQHHGLRDRVRHEQHRGAGLAARSAAARPASARGSSRRARRTARPSAAASGSGASARAIATRCCMPPESWLGREPAKSASPTSSSSSAARARRCGLGDAVHLQRQLDVLRDRAPLQQPGLLERDPVVLVEPGLVRRSCRRPRRCPAVGCSRSATTRSSVDLPQPGRPDQRHELAGGRCVSSMPVQRLHRRRSACRSVSPHARQLAPRRRVTRTLPR